MNTHPPDFDEGIPNDLNHLLISFRFVNYSDSPAVITDLRAAAFLGPGPNTGYGQLGPDLSEAEKFFVRLKDPRKWGRNRLERPDFHIYEVRTIEYQDENGKLTHQLISIPFSFQPGIVMVGNISTGKFACLCEVFTGRASADEIEKLFRAMRWNAIRPWLIGSVRYEDMYRRPYQTNFCVSVEFHRGPAHEEGGPPYNMRT